MVIFNLERFAIIGKCVKSYIKRADAVGKKKRLKRLGYNGWYNSREVNKFREIKDILNIFYNKKNNKEEKYKKGNKVQVECKKD